MSNRSAAGASTPRADGAELQRVIHVTPKAAWPRSTLDAESAPADARIFQLDAGFESAGTWAGVQQLVEMAYLSLMEMEQHAIVEEHEHELYMVLPGHRDRVRPKFLCLTDTAGANERTRFYALDRAYRLVNGLVGLVLQWKLALHDRSRWIVVVRNFDHAQHLATRFFAELARRSAAEGAIDVVIETGRDLSDIASRLPGMQPVPAARWIAELEPEAAAPQDINDIEIRALEAEIADGAGSLLEQKYQTLLTHYVSSGDGLAAARIALKVFVIYNSCGYYHEARCLMKMILPYFDQLVAGDEERRINYAGKMNLCMVQVNDTDQGLEILENFAGKHLTKPHVLASINYMLGIHYIRYAETKDVSRSEQHLLLAVDLIRAANDNPESRPNPFLKVFIDNGLALLRARQGRHQEALDLCISGYEFLTREMGEDRHRLHRSVLLYNIAQVYVMIGRLDEGVKYFHKAIEMDPYYSEYHNEIGNLFQELDDYQQAIGHYALAIKYSAPYPEVYFNKAVCHLRLGELDDALGCFDTTLELNPGQLVAHALRADVLRELDRADEALEGYDGCIALGYEATAVRVNRAVLHYNNGSYALALADMDQVIAREARDPAHYENRAAIYQALNLEELRLRDLATAELCREAA
jgi:tetratricopeptide (TPR) repeat protein